MKRKAGHFRRQFPGLRPAIILYKWSDQTHSTPADARALTVFRSYYAKGEDYLVTPQEAPAYRKRFAKLEVTVCGPQGIGAAEKATGAGL